MSIKLKGTTAGSAVILAAPADTSPTGTEKTFTLPTQDGDAGQILKTDGSGALSFTDNLASNRNLIINGAMNVAQRGTSSTSSGHFTVDRFKQYFTQVSVTQSQQTLSSGSPYDEGFRYFVRMANTTTSSSTASQVEIQYRMEAQDLAQSGWNYKSTSSYVTFSFWARSSLAGTYYVTFRNSDANPLQYIASFTLVADTWTKVTHTIPGNSNVVFNNDNGIGLQIQIVPHYGTNLTGSGAQLNTWHDRSGSDYFPDYAQNWSNTSGATFDVTGVQLEVGSKATSFEHRTYGDELARCQRYCQVLGGDSYKQVAAAMRATTTTAKGQLKLVTTMRASPTASTIGSGSFRYQSGDTLISGDVDFSSLWTAGTDHNYVWADWAPGSGTFAGSAKDYGMIYCNNGATRKLVLNAEL
jgi:hypothetical protein